jgi:hypothetical protein
MLRETKTEKCLKPEGYLFTFVLLEFLPHFLHGFLYSLLRGDHFCSLRRGPGIDSFSQRMICYREGSMV